MSSTANAKNLSALVVREHLPLLTEIQQATGKSFSQLVNIWIIEQHQAIAQRGDVTQEGKQNELPTTPDHQ